MLYSKIMAQKKLYQRNFKDFLSYVYKVYTDSEVLKVSGDTMEDIKKKYPEASRIERTDEIEPKF